MTMLWQVATFLCAMGSVILAGVLIIKRFSDKGINK